MRSRTAEGIMESRVFSKSGVKSNFPAVVGPKECRPSSKVV